MTAWGKRFLPSVEMTGGGRNDEGSCQLVVSSGIKTGDTALSYLQELLTSALECGASDIHVMVGEPPLLRIHTVLQKTDYAMVTSEGAL
jgi:hypothetical protein